MHIGVFDSGKGGHLVAARLRKAFPHAKVTDIDDSGNVPYGSKSEKEIFDLTHAAIRPLLDERCDVIVIACNTATAAAIDKLRSAYPDQKFIGFEPMIKPAALATKNGTIAVLATPATLRSARYKNLKEQWAADKMVIEPNCTRWASQIESGKPPYDNALSVVNGAVTAGSDVIVLACTHYLELESFIRQHVPANVTVIEPTTAVIKRIRSLVSDKPATV